MLNSIGPNTKAVIPVHLYGSAVDEKILDEFAKHLVVIEDSSQAHGARFKSGKGVGSKSKINCYSLYPGKNLGAAGEAGICTTDEPALAERLKSFRNWGSKIKYYHQDFGVNYRMDEIQASVLYWKLLKLNQWTKQRRDIASQYREVLDDIEINCVNSEVGYPVYHQFVINHSDRDMLQVYLKNNGVDTQIHYPVAIHQQLALKNKYRVNHNLENTEMLVKNILSLPIYPGLTPEEISIITKLLREYNA